MSAHEEIVRRFVGDHIRQCRQALEWRLEDVVERVSSLGVRLSRSTLHRIESGESNLPLGTVLALCSTLGTSLGFIEELVSVADAEALSGCGGGNIEELLAAGHRHCAQGDVVRALCFFSAVRDLLIGRDERPAGGDRLAMIFVHIAECHLRLNHFASSWDAAGKALNVKGCSKKTRLSALLVHVSIGCVTGDLFRARLFARQAEAMLVGVRAPLRAFGLAVLGELDLEQGRYDLAVPRLSRARSLLQRLGPDARLARVTVALGHTLQKLGKTRRGLELIHEGHDLASSRQIVDVALFALRTLAGVEAELGRWADARVSFDRAAALARKEDLRQELFLTWYGRWKAARATGMGGEERRARTVLQRLLKKVYPGLPQAGAFLTSLVREGTEGSSSLPCSLRREFRSGFLRRGFAFREQLTASTDRAGQGGESIRRGDQGQAPIC